MSLLSEHDLKAFGLDGFLHLEQFLDRQTSAALCAWVDELANNDTAELIKYYEDAANTQLGRIEDGGRENAKCHYDNQIGYEVFNILGKHGILYGDRLNHWNPVALRNFLDGSRRYFSTSPPLLVLACNHGDRRQAVLYQHFERGHREIRRTHIDESHR